MSPEDIFKAKDPDLIQSMAAMKRAALEARKIAIQTGTSIIVRDNGRIIRRSAKELERELQRQIVEDQVLSSSLGLGDVLSHDQLMIIFGTSLLH